jgi:hypothetical protein
MSEETTRLWATDNRTEKGKHRTPNVQRRTPNAERRIQEQRANSKERAKSKGRDRTTRLLTTGQQGSKEQRAEGKALPEYVLPRFTTGLAEGKEQRGEDCRAYGEVTGVAVRGQKSKSIKPGFGTFKNRQFLRR